MILAYAGKMTPAACHDSQFSVIINRSDFIRHRDASLDRSDRVRSSTRLPDRSSPRGYYSVLTRPTVCPLLLLSSINRLISGTRPSDLCLDNRWSLDTGTRRHIIAVSHLIDYRASSPYQAAAQSAICMCHSDMLSARLDSATVASVCPLSAQSGDGSLRYGHFIELSYWNMYGKLSVVKWHPLVNICQYGATGHAIRAVW